MTLNPPTRIDQVILDIQERFGQHAIQRLADHQPSAPQATGIPALDALLGGGLLPGVLTAFQGAGTSGRVTLARRILANTQATVSVYLDVCETFDAESASRNGVDLERLILVHPDGQLLDLLGALLTLRVPFILLDESDAKEPAPIPAVILAQLAQVGTILLHLPPDRQAPGRAGARLMVERVAWLRSASDGDIIGCQSRITVFEQRGVHFGSHVTLDLMLEGA